MIRIMVTDIEIAREHYDNERGLRLMVSRPNLKPLFLLRELFFDEQVATWDRFYEWVSSRIVPPYRVGIDELLKEINLGQYDVWEIAKKTKASLMDDPYWVAFSSEDSYKKDTIRGRFGFPEIPVTHVLFSE